MILQSLKRAPAFSMSTRQMKLLAPNGSVAGKLSLTPVSILKYSYCPLRLTIFPYLEFPALEGAQRLDQL